MLFRKEIKNRPIDFLILYLGFSIAALVYFSFPYPVMVRKLVVIAMGLFYFFWGVWHHKQRGDFCPKVGAEYLLFAILGTSIILSAILRG